MMQPARTTGKALLSVSLPSTNCVSVPLTFHEQVLCLDEEQDLSEQEPRGQGSAGQEESWRDTGAHDLEAPRGIDTEPKVQTSAVVAPGREPGSLAADYGLRPRFDAPALREDVDVGAGFKAQSTSPHIARVWNGMTAGEAAVHLLPGIGRCLGIS